MLNLLAETEATFETGLSTGWVPTATFTPFDTTLTRRTDGGHTGSAYIRIATAAGDAVQSLQAHLTRTITVNDTLNYMVSFWVRPTTSLRVEFQAALLDSGGTSLSALTAAGSVLTPNVWNYVESAPLATPAGTVAATVRLAQFGTSGGSSPGDTFDADDLFFGERITEITDDTGTTDLVGTDLITPILVGGIRKVKSTFADGSLNAIS